MKAKEKLRTHLILLFTSVFILGLFSCSSDDNNDDGGGSNPDKQSIYKVVVTFDKINEDYLRQVNITPISYTSSSLDILDDSGKPLNKNNLTSLNYTFSNSNTFTTAEKVNSLILTISISYISTLGENSSDLNTTIKVYRDSELIFETAETATSKKRIEISKILDSQSSLN